MIALRVRHDLDITDGMRSCADGDRAPLRQPCLGPLGPPRFPGTAALSHIRKNMSHIPSFRFNLYTEQFRQLTAEQHQGVRGHPDRPVKERQGMDQVTEESLKRTGSNAREFNPSSGQDARMRRFVLNGRNTVKPAGFRGPLEPIASRGTSRPDTLCFTDWLETCAGLAIGGEKIQDNVAAPGAKARIWHVSGFETEEQKNQLRAYCKRLRDDHLTIRWGAFGGRAGLSEKLVEDLLSFMRDETGTEPEFNETCANRKGDDDTPFGIAIRDDHTLQFVTDIRRLSADEVSVEFSDFGGDSDGESDLEDSDSDSRN